MRWPVFTSWFDITQPTPSEPSTWEPHSVIHHQLSAEGVQRQPGCVATVAGRPVRGCRNRGQNETRSWTTSCTPRPMQSARGRSGAGRRARPTVIGWPSRRRYGRRRRRTATSLTTWAGSSPPRVTSSASQQRARAASTSQRPRGSLRLTTHGPSVRAEIRSEASRSLRRR